MKKDISNEEPTTAGAVYFEKKGHHPGSFFWPFLLITLGIVFLLNNFDLIPWTIWNTLIRFWPLIMILVGLEILLGRGKLANLIVSLIGIIIVLTILGIYVPQFSQWTTQTISQLNQYNLKYPFNR